MNEPATQSASSDDKSAGRNLGAALTRGFRGRCPACGKGHVLQGYIFPRTECESCRENLAPYQSADFAPYLVTFAIGLTFTPLILIATMLWDVPAPLALTVGLSAALACALTLLPRMKGAAIGLLWALDVRANI